MFIQNWSFEHGFQLVTFTYCTYVINVKAKYIRGFPTDWYILV